MRRAAAISVLVLALAGCGGGEGGSSALGGGSTETGPGSASASADEQVIREWSESLRAGDVTKASSLFAVPATVANGTPPLKLRSRRAVRAFNVALPCGAKLVETVEHQGYVIAEFELTDREGEGAVRPCSGKGASASTAFRIRDGLIVEWIRADGIGRPAPGDAPGTEV